MLRPLQGTGATITAVASGAEPLTYEWFFSSRLQSPVATGPILDLDAGPNERAIWLRVSNAAGVAVSDPITVRSYHRQAPEFASTPRDFTLTPNEPFTVDVKWTGSLPLTIDWLKNGQIVQSGPSSRFHVDAATASDGGVYTVRLSNPYGSRESQFKVSPVPPPEPQAPLIVLQPESIETEVDYRYFERPTLHGSANIAASEAVVEVLPNEYSSTYTLVKAQGSPPMTFELIRDGVVVSQTTTHAVADVQLGQIYHPMITPDSYGDYYVRVHNSEGSVDSDPFQLRRPPLSAPRVISGLPPGDMNVPPGSSVYWSVSFAGTPPLSIQWFKDGQPLAGRDYSNLSINNLKESDSGSYTVRVEGPGGRLVTQPAQLTVGSPPPSAPRFSPSGPTFVEFTSNVYQTLNFTYSFTGTTPMTYAWQRNGLEIPGETNPWLELNGEAVDVVGNYHLTATNDYGSATALVAVVEERPGVAPQIVFEPAGNVPLEAGGNLVLEPQVEGNPAPTFQWFKDGQEINFATNASLYRYGVTTDASGTYHLVATNHLGSVRSRDFVVTVDASFPPQIVSHPESFHASSPHSGGSLSVRIRNTFGATYQWFRDGEVIAGQRQSYYFTSISPFEPGTYTVQVSQNGQTVTSAPAVITSGDPVSPIIRSSGGRVLRADTSNALSSLPGDYNSALLEIRTTDVPDSVVWQRNGEVVPNQTDMFFWSDAWDGQEGDYNAVVTTSQGTFTSQPMRLEHYSDEPLPVIRTQPKSQSVGIGDFGYTGPRLTIEFSTPTPWEIQWFHDGVAIPGALGPTLVFESFHEDDVGNYVARISTPLGTVESEAAYVDTLPLDLPVIVRQPRGVTVTNPNNRFAPISVEVTSPHQVSYAWYLDGTLLPELTESSVSLPSDTSFAPATLRVAVTSAAGTVWSDPAEILLDDRPVGPEAIVSPANRSAGLGASITLSPTIINPPGEPSYQWFHNGERIQDATSVTLSLENLSSSDAGEYTVTISTGSFSFTSIPATVEITNAFSPLKGRHRIVGNGVFDGQPIRIHTRLTHPGDLTAASYSLLLPTGWSLASQDATGTSAAPITGETDLLEWAWSTVPASPINFEFTLTPPAGTTGTEELAALLESTYQFLDFQALAMPDPVRLAPVPTRHSADVDDDGRIDLSELLRVIELYNTRNGSARTGRYTLSTTSADGFAPDATEPETTESRLRNFHLADSDWDGALSLSELLRVIELYNTRSGSTRTGAYHPTPATVDGFAPGSGE